MTFELYEEFLRAAGTMMHLCSGYQTCPCIFLYIICSPLCTGTFVWCSIAGQERSGEGCVHSNRSAQSNSPQHSGETHLSFGQVNLNTLFELG